MSMCSFFWESQIHLSNAAFCLELAAGAIELVVGVVIVTTFHKEWDEPIKKRIEFLFEVGFLIAALIAVIAIVSNRRLETLRKLDEMAATTAIDNAVADAKKARAEARAAATNALNASTNAAMIVSNAEKEGVLNAPWRISDDQQAKFATLLTNIPKGNVSVWTYLDGQYPGRDVLNDIIKMLNSAGYSTSNSFGKAMWSAPPPDGLLMLVKDASNAPTFAPYLQKAFEMIGLPCPGSKDPTCGVNEIRIMVGAKPKP